MAKRRIISTNPDLTNYVLVKSKEGDYLRRKRGTVTKATINEAFAAHANETCSSAAKEIMDKLKPFTQQMYGRKLVYLSALLRKGRLRSGFTDYSDCDRWEVMKDHPLNKIYWDQYSVKKEKDTVDIVLAVAEDSINKEGMLATHFYFEAILVHGDAMVPGAVRMESDRSPLYSFKSKKKTSHTFSFVIPEGRPYLVFLKVGCMENDRPADHPRHYGMKVVAVG